MLDSKKHSGTGSFHVLDTDIRRTLALRISSLAFLVSIASGRIAGTVP